MNRFDWLRAANFALDDMCDPGIIYLDISYWLRRYDESLQYAFAKETV